MNIYFHLPYPPIFHSIYRFFFKWNQTCKKSKFYYFIILNFFSTGNHPNCPYQKIRRKLINKIIYSVSIANEFNFFQTSQAAASSGLHLQAARITSPPSRAKSRPSLRA
jgi:hypothetical protein